VFARKEQTLNICAGIITNNPDIDRLTKNINAVLPQVKQLILIDNASTDIDELQKTFNAGKIEWIKNEVNKGVAGALNQLIDFAEKHGYEWILTLDDDSVCSDNMVAELLTATSHCVNIAMVSPIAIDREITGTTTEITNDKDKQPPDIKEVDMCITAGCLTNVKAVIDTGGFDEYLFIDHVDHDMCLRLKHRGYRIIEVGTAKIFQEFGRETIRRRFLWKTYTQRGYTPFRVYYQTRNSVYMLRKYGKEFDSGPCYFYFYLVFAFIARFIYEPNRFHRLKAFTSGYFAGFRMKTNENP